jgi:hypothetical protein
MSLAEYVVPLLLVASVLRQWRGKPLGWLQLLWPVGVVVWACARYLRGFPPTSSDLVLVCGCALAGVALGAGAAVKTRIYRGREGTLMARATPAAVALWTAGALGRLTFGLYAEHGGAQTIASFSAAHRLAFQAWPAALTLMALAEVLGRTAVLAPRAFRSASEPPPSASG